MPDALPAPLRVPTRALFAIAATPVHRAIRPMIALLDAPPSSHFAAYRATARPAFDSTAARRLHELTTSLIERV
ncbi:hypothetical protein [Acrocarpospora catenulata]|uniref:hypothetical protein n=1 Tax=Acrocarpospora catenulata TaxID=2836182 RepID=UPI001BD97A51|nr:hypothetical protein [Acrocarpospora catenulata]